MSSRPDTRLVLVVGPSGGGKTTFIEMLEQAGQGEVEVIPSYTTRKVTPHE